MLTAKVSFTGAIAFSLEKLGLPNVSLKAEQPSAIQECTRDGMCLPTGYGKSLCYQTLPFVMDHKCCSCCVSTHRSYGRAGPTVKILRGQGVSYDITITYYIIHFRHSWHYNDIHNIFVAHAQAVCTRPYFLLLLGKNIGTGYEAGYV